ncbi:MAG TPA: glycerophosphodiester phosphodiesterase [Candidatus Dormibacteraeota bacterium]|nr:glycerophosphodiester phosphodiesterase [Candidatus Dormibacteraeota bacterium]
MSQIIGFAHRGGATSRHLQNTLEAFRVSLEAGAGGIESDVALTADGVAVLIHPGVIARLRRPVSRVRRDELPAHVPSVEDVYREFGSRLHVSLDMAAPAAAAQVVAVARKHGDPSRLWLTYWRLDAVRQWRRRYPDVRLVFPALWLRSGDDGRRVAALQSAGVDALNLYHRACTPSRAAAVHDAGLLLFGWGARTGNAAARTLRQGADGVFCDDTAGMVHAIAAETRRREAVSAGR